MSNSRATHASCMQTNFLLAQALRAVQARERQPLARPAPAVEASRAVMPPPSEARSDAAKPLAARQARVTGPQQSEARAVSRHRVELLVPPNRGFTLYERGALARTQPPDVPYQPPLPLLGEGASAAEPELREGAVSPEVERVRQVLMGSACSPVKILQVADGSVWKPHKR